MPKPVRDALLTLLEVAFVLVALAGIAMVYPPAALIVGGLVGVAAIEWAGRRETPAAPLSGPQRPGTPS